MTNFEYETRRDNLIPLAVSYANKVAGTEPVFPKNRKKNSVPLPRGYTYYWAAKWNQAYLSEMDRLARKEGLMA